MIEREGMDTKDFDARNGEKSRSVCERIHAEHARHELSEKERLVLDMWPRYEDGEPVMIGDEAISNRGDRFRANRILFTVGCCALNDDPSIGHYKNVSGGKRVQRPARGALDADGVEIKVGDTVWHEDGSELRVIDFGGVEDGETILAVKCMAGPIKWSKVGCLSVTHTRPDSWELWERDLRRGETCEEACDELVRRAKALAGR